MYIKSMVVDGFKSYAQRTEINGFDRLFNAITGLNGSGKSNILDAICFLLGITNLSQVRAGSLQELVYKNGQAGVSKATVSITFDNSNKEQSPLGYEQYDEITVTRQVVIGGRNKYLINGSNANNTRVQDLFRSVQLNINNPHFLIMQGRITKVLNMKPLEILSMIEEAAGTRLYESKKESAEKTIAKKDAKLNEIDRVVKEDITPTLTKLREERSSYLEYQKIVRELEHLNKLCIAFHFMCADEQHHKSAEELDEMRQNIEHLQQAQTEHQKRITELDDVIAELQKKKDKEAGGSIDKLERELSERQKVHAKADSDVTHTTEALKVEVKRQKDLTKQQNTDEATLKSKRKELEKVAGRLSALEETQQECVEQHSAAQKHFHAVSAGLSSNQDGEDASLNDQLMAAKKEISTTDTDIKQAQMTLKHSKEELKKKQADMKKTDSTYKQDKATYDSAKKNMLKIEEEMKKLDYEEGREEELTGRKRELQQEIGSLMEQVEALEARFPQLQFYYKDPEPHFDRRRIHGLVVKLISVNDTKAATALEVVAGGKLYNVVVDSEVTGKSLLKNGQLKRRCTIIPLNKVVSHSINPQVVKRAQSLAGQGTVQTALSLVGYQQELEAAMKFVFGSSFVCSDMETAKHVTFDSKVMKRSVTLEGEMFDPSGTLRGGSRARTGSILTKLSELKDAQDALYERQQELKKVENELAAMAKSAHKWHQLKQKYDLSAHEVALTEGKMKASSHHKQLEEIAALQKTVEDQAVAVDQAVETQRKAKQRVKELEAKLHDAKGEREKELRNAENCVAKAKTKMEEASKKTKELHQDVESRQLEVEELLKDLSNYEQQLAAVTDTMKGYEEQLLQLKDAATQAEAKVKEVQGRLDDQKQLLRECDKDISARVKEQQTLHKQVNHAQLQVQETEHKLSKMTKDSRDAARQVEHLLQKHHWIADERQYFGKANTAYDFAANDPKEANRKVQKLETTKEKLSRSVNMRAMTMLGKAEEQYNDLMKKRRIVFNDKMKITAVIAELDLKKNEALKKAHLQVNKDFGSIFSTLLPGTDAKLVAPEGQSILDGLEVNIAFGNVWKESLSELSGGQRSLVALSLILALLLFKPAPLYILDEVDAALDLSHTQNIGHMLRTHFRHSQFIVVSLKDGMFNNANVLFKTRFIDGVSTVTRYTQSHSTSRTGSSSETPLVGRSKAGKKKDTSSKRARLQSDISV